MNKKKIMSIFFSAILLFNFFTVTVHAMTVFVDVVIQNGSGETITLDVESDESIEEIKHKINDITGIARERQTLTFKGTELEDDFTIRDYNIQEEATLYLTYTIEVSYDGNGADGYVDIQIKEAGEEFTLSDNAFWKENANFVGWCTESDGSAEVYSEGQPVSFMWDTVLYAQWEEEPGNDDIEVEYIELNEWNLELDIGETGYLNATVYPEDAIEQEITWSSSDECIAIVNEIGRVTAVGYGETYIVAETSNCTRAECRVEVASKYIVTYRLDDDTVFGTRRIIENHEYLNIRPEELENYTDPENGMVFYYWSDSINGEEYKEPLVSDITLYAVYGEGVTVYYHDENGQLIGTRQVSPFDYDWNCSPETFEYIGGAYDFIGWSLYAGSRELYQELPYDGMNVFLVAYKYYDVSYYDGNQLLGTVSVREDNYSIYVPGSFDDYHDEERIFIWWSADPDGERLTGNITGNTNLYAVYGIGSITYYDSYGNFLGTITIKNSYERNIDPGYFPGLLSGDCEFNGWRIGSPDGESFDGEAYDGLCLYADIDRYYTVRYLLEDDSLLEEYRLLENEQVELDINNIFGYDPEEYGQFAYWRDQYNNYYYGSDTLYIREDMYLYAVFEHGYVVTFYDFYGNEVQKEMSGWIDGGYDPSNVFDNAEIEGYRFNGWTLTDQGEDYYYGYAYDGLVLYARYERVYNVTYYLNENTPLYTKQCGEYDYWNCDIFEIPGYTPVYDDLAFYGWSDTPNGEEYGDLIYEDMNFYAIFREGVHVNYHDTNGNLLRTLCIAPYRWRIISPYYFEGYQAPDMGDYAGWTTTLGSKECYEYDAYEGMDVYPVYYYRYEITCYDGDKYLGTAYVREDELRWFAPENFDEYEAEGRNFIWWSTTPDGEEYQGNLYEDTTLYAVFGAGKVWYYNPYGSELGYRGLRNADDWDITPETFSNWWIDEECEFVGWSDAGPDGELFTGEAYDGLRLYAVVRMCYRVEYYDSDGCTYFGTRKLEGGSSVDYDISNFDNYVPQEGRVFLYWSLYPNGDRYYGEVYDNLTVYAVYEQQYLVNYYDGQTLKDSRYVGADNWNIDPLEIDPDWTKEGCRFVGWSLSKGYYTYPGTIYENTSLYAIFEKVHTVIYYVNGTEIGRRTDAISNDYGYYIDEELIPEGYHFVYWKEAGTDREFQGEFKEITELHAVFGKNECLVTLDFNDETGRNNEYTVYEVNGLYDILNESGNVPYRDGYSFLGWSLQPDEYVAFDRDIILDDITLYAYWIEIGKGLVSIEFVPMNGQISVDSSLYSVEGLGTYDVGQTATVIIEFIDDCHYIVDSYIEGMNYELLNDNPAVYQQISFVVEPGFNQIVVISRRGNQEYRFITGDDETTDYEIIATDRLGNLLYDPSPEKQGYFLIGWEDIYGNIIDNITAVLTFYNEQYDEAHVFRAVWGEAGKICNVNIEFYEVITEPSGIQIETAIVPEGITVVKNDTGLTGEWFDFDVIIDPDTQCGLGVKCVDSIGNYLDRSFIWDETDNVYNNDKLFSGQTVHYSVRILDEENLNIHIVVKKTLQLFVEYGADGVQCIVSDPNMLKHQHIYEIGETVIIELPGLYKGYQFDESKPLIIEGWDDGRYSLDGVLFQPESGEMYSDAYQFSEDRRTLTWTAGFGNLHISPNIIFTGLHTATENSHIDLLRVNNDDDYSKPGIVFYNPTDKTENYNICFGMEYQDEYVGSPFEGIGRTVIYRKTGSLTDGTAIEEPGEEYYNLQEYSFSVGPNSYVSLSFDNYKEHKYAGSIDNFFYKIYNTTSWTREVNKGCISKNDTLKHLEISNEHGDIVSRRFGESEIYVPQYRNYYLWIESYPAMDNEFLVNPVTFVLTSSDESVVKVDPDNPQIYPVGIGTATVTFTSSDGFTDSCEVHVVENGDDYFVTLDVNGGEPLISDTVAVNHYTNFIYFSPTMGISTPVREGYVFAGWTFERDTLPLLQETSGYFTEGRTLYAYWIEEGKSLVRFRIISDSGDSEYVVTGNGLYNDGDEVTASISVTDSSSYISSVDVENIDAMNHGIDGIDFGDTEFPTTDVTVKFKTTEGTVFITAYLYSGENQITIMNDDDTVNTVLVTDRFGVIYDSEFPEMTKDGYYLLGWKTGKYDNYPVSKSGDHYVFTEDAILYPFWDEAGVLCNVNVNMSLEDDKVSIEGSGQYYSGEEITVRAVVGDTYIGIFNLYHDDYKDNGELLFVKDLDGCSGREGIYHNETVEWKFTVPATENLYLQIIAENTLQAIIDNPCPEILTVNRITTAKAGERITIVFNTAPGYELSKEAQFLKGMPSGGGGWVALNGDFFAKGYLYKVNDAVVDTSVTNQLSWIAGIGEFGRWANIIYVGNNTAQEEEMSDVVNVTSDSYNAPGVVVYNDSTETRDYIINLNRSVADEYKVSGSGEMMSLADHSMLRATGKSLMDIVRANATESITQPVSGSDGIGNVTVYVKKGVYGDDSSVKTETITVNNLSALKLTIQPGEYVSYSINDEAGERYYEYRYRINDYGSDIDLGYVNDGDTAKHLLVSGPVVAVESIEMDEPFVALPINSVSPFKAVISPANATNKKIEWSSDDPSVATVDETGLVQGVGKGKTTIRAFCNGLEATCMVLVYDSNEEYTVTLDRNGGVSGESTTRVVSGGTKVLFMGLYSEDAGTREGYVCVGWSRQKDEFPLTRDYDDYDEDMYITEDTTLYAYWIPEDKTVIRLRDRFFTDASKGFSAEDYEVTGLGTYDNGSTIEVTFRILDDVDFIRACYVEGTTGIYHMSYDLAETEVTVSFTAEGGLLDFEPYVEEGFKTLTIIPDDGDVFVAQADRFNYINAELPVYIKEGYYLKGFEEEGNIDLYSAVSLKRISKNLTVVPVWDKTGVPCRVNVTHTSDDDNYIYLEGAGEYLSGQTATIKVKFAGNKYRNIYSVRAENVSTGGTVFVKGIDEFNNALDNAHFYSSVEPVEIPITVPDEDEINLIVDIKDKLTVKMNNPCPEILNVQEDYTVNAGERITIVFDTLPGYELSKESPFMWSKPGWSEGPYISQGLYGRVLMGEKGEKVNKEIVETEITNQLSWIAGAGTIVKWPNIIYVGYGTENEEELQALIQTSDEDENGAAGLLIYNSTEEAKEYLIEFGESADSTGSSMSGNMNALLRAAGTTSLTRSGSGLENVTLRIVRVNIATGEETVTTQFYENLSTVTITVNPGEYVSYSVDDENGDSYDEYRYTITDTESNQEVRTGYVNSDDTLKHLLVSDQINITSITLDRDSIELQKGETDTLTATVNPEGTTEDKTVIWSSSDDNVVTVDNDGNITAVNYGKAEITATASNGMTAVCKVTVKSDRPIIILDPNGGSEIQNNIIEPEDYFSVWNLTDDQIPVREGYVLCGWSTVRDQRPFVDRIDSFDDVMVLYACWMEETKAVVSLDANCNDMLPGLDYTITGLGEYAAGEEVTVTITINDEQYYIETSGIHCLTKDHYVQYDLEIPYLTREIVFTAEAGYNDVVLWFAKGHSKATFVMDENDRSKDIVLTSNQMGLFDKDDIPEAEKDGFLFTGWAWSPEDHYAEQFNNPLGEDTVFYPIFIEKGLSTSVSVRFIDQEYTNGEYIETELDPSDFVITGTGNCESGEEISIHISSTGNRKYIISSAFVYDENGNGYGSGNGNDFNDKKYLGPEGEEFCVTAQEVPVTLEIRVYSHMIVEINNNLPEIVTVVSNNAETPIATGEMIEIEFTVAEGYKLNPDKPFWNPNNGVITSHLSYGKPILTLRDSFDGWSSYTIDKSVLNTEEENKISWPAGGYWWDFTPNIIYVGTATEDEIMLADILETSEDNGAGVLIYNNTEEEQNYTINFENITEGNEMSPLSVTNPFSNSVMSEVVTEGGSYAGLGNVRIYITTGTIGDEANAHTEERVVKGLKSLDVTVSKGEYVSYTIVSEDSNVILKQYKYECVDQDDSSVNEQGYVNNQDAVKHLIKKGNVPVSVPVTSIALNKETLTLNKGETETLTATVLPENATDKSVTWTSSDESVTTVDENGVVTAVSAGTATITVTASNGLTAACEVKVLPGITEETVVIMGSSLVLEGIIQIQFRVIVPDAENKKIVIKFEGEKESNSYEESYDAVERRHHTAETAQGTEYYYRVSVYAKQMNDKVTIWFTDLEGNRVSFYRGSGVDVTESGYEYSVATYINNMWNSSKEKTRNLVRAMKYYGLYAQKEFDYEVALADELLAELEPMQDVEASELEMYAKQYEGEAPEGLSLAGYSMTLTDDVRINYRLDVGEGVNPKTYEIRVDGVKVTAKKSGSNWYVYKKNIVAKDLDTMHELSISDGTKTIVYRYGVLTYCYNKISSDDTRESLKNLCKAIYWYSKAADAYWGN